MMRLNPSIIHALLKMTEPTQPNTRQAQGGEFAVKSFHELTTGELMAIYRLRQQVFIIEQNCPYPDIDDSDLIARHVFNSDHSKIVAYARIVTDEFGDFHIGRVVVAATQRHQGLGQALMKTAIGLCQDRDSQRPIIISAQSYLSAFYQALGFEATGDYYLEDNIPHMRMILALE